MYIMKQNKKELDVDFIGGQGSFTKEEEEMINAFIKASKDKKDKVKVTKEGGLQSISVQKFSNMFKTEE